MINLNKVSFAGWPNCLKLSNDSVEMIITTDVGPRILHFGWKDEPERLFYIDPKTKGSTGGDEFKLYGGHRFWHGPEVKPRTYVPDNAPVAHEWDGRTLRLVPDVEQLTGLQKIIEIQLHESQPDAILSHQLVNHGQFEISAAPWALSVLAEGGTAMIPQEPFVKFPDALLPARPLVLWQYTNMTDPRFYWGPQYVTLKQDPSTKAPQKFGVLNSVGWGCYVLNDTAFIKRTTVQPSATYPDFGCNWETYTNAHFLELETLGPLAPIAPGSMASHKESWSLLRIKQGAGMDEVYQQVQGSNVVKA